MKKLIVAMVLCMLVALVAVAVVSAALEAVWVDPPSVTVKRGQTFTVDIKAEVSDLYGAEFDLGFAPAVVMATEVISGTIFTNGYVAQSEIGTGVVEFAATRCNPDGPFSDTGTMASIVFQALAPGSSTLLLDALMMANIDGIPILGVTTTPGEIVVLGWGDLQGSVELQGRVGPDWDGAQIAGKDGYIYNTPVADPNGTWSITEVVSGTYTVEVEMDRYLDARREGVAVADLATVTLSQVRLLGGDADDSDKVDLADLVLIGGAYGTSDGGGAPWNPKADINDDKTVNILDLVLAGGNYGKQSITDVPWTP